jgi:hypothetical protein
MEETVFGCKTTFQNGTMISSFTHFEVFVDFNNSTLSISKLGGHPVIEKIDLLENPMSIKDYEKKLIEVAKADLELEKYVGRSE